MSVIISKNIKTTQRCATCNRKLAKVKHMLVDVDRNFTSSDIEAQVLQQCILSKCKKHPNDKVSITYSYYHEKTI